VIVHTLRVIVDPEKVIFNPEKVIVDPEKVIVRYKKPLFSAALQVPKILKIFKKKRSLKNLLR